ncbi:symporter small accessory protein [Desulfofalx alkaliphila]
MLNLPDPQIWLAYILCIGASLLCIVYGTINWNSDK